jgi:hypothetical protein
MILIASREFRQGWSAKLGQLVDGPIGLACFDHDKCRGLWAHRALPVSGRSVEKCDWEFVTAWGEFPSVSNFVAGARGFGGGEEVVHGIFVGLFFKMVSEHEDAGFLVIGLPGVQEAIGGGKGDHVIVVHGRGRATRSAGCNSGGEIEQQERWGESADQAGESLCASAGHGL